MPAARTSSNGNAASLPIPVLTPKFKVVRLRFPAHSGAYVSDAGHAVAGFLPPPERLAFYGGLGVAAVVGLIDWPVATAIGLGTLLARKASRSRADRSRSGGRT